MIYFFDSKMAEENGINQAIIYEFLIRNILYNKIHKQREEDGLFWTPVSYAALHVMMPFMGVTSIYRAISNLVMKGYILKKTDKKMQWFSAPNKVLENSTLPDVPIKTEELGPETESKALAFRSIASIEDKSNTSLDIISPKETTSKDIINPPIVPPRNENEKTDPAARDLLSLTAEFAEHRKQIKSPFTAKGRILFFNRLQRFKMQGYNVEEMVDLAIMSGWKSVHEPHQNYKSASSKQEAPKFIRQGMNPDLIEKDMYEQYKSAEQGDGNGDSYPSSISLPSPDNREPN